MTATGYRPLPSVLSAIDVRRLENDAIRDEALRFVRDGAGTVGFMCECGDLRCLRVVWRSLADYETAEPGSVRDH